MILKKYSLVTTKLEYILLKKENCLEKIITIKNSMQRDINVAIAAPRIPNTGKPNFP